MDDPNEHEVMAMFEYFRGCKRKAGLVTLVIACVFAAEWVRSTVKEQKFPISSSEYGVLQLESANGILEWQQVTPDTVVSRDALLLREQFIELLATEKATSGVLKMRETGRHEFRNSGLTLTVWILPYWIITFPLTVLSAWLLLSKRRRPANLDQPQDTVA